LVVDGCDHGSGVSRFLRRLAGIATAIRALSARAAAAGCGGGHDASTADSSADPTPTATQDSREPGRSGSEVTATPEAGAGSTVDVAADPSGALAYEPTELTAKAGLVTIDLANETQTQMIHSAEGWRGRRSDRADHRLDDPADVELDAGSYTYYCSVPGHLEARMKGSLTVS
jgi:plastocyanin